MRRRAIPHSLGRLPGRLAVLLACFLGACHDGAAPERTEDHAGSTAGGSEAPPVLALDGTPADLEPAADAPAQVFLFTASDCPVSNRYAPEVRRLVEAFAADGVEFVLVYADPVDDAERVRRHVEDYDYPCRAVLDHGHRLVARTGARMTPEAAVYDRDGRLVYRGRIDDRNVEYGVERREATSRELFDVLTALVAGERLEPTTTDAVGCFIPPL